MPLEILSFAVLIAAAAYALPLLPGPGRPVRFVLALLLGGLAATCLLATRPGRRAATPAVTDRPLELPEDGFAGSAGCRSCHPGHHATWHSSYHRTMTQIASKDSVLGNFEDVKLARFGRTVHLRHEGEKFLMDVEPGRGTTRRIVMTTGSHHEQVYWYATGEGRRIGNLPFIWLIPEAEWVPYESVFLQPPRDTALPMVSGQWNRNCIKCHATHGRPRFGYPGPVLTEAAEFGISCEACHGPGAAHMRDHRDPLQRYLLQVTKKPDPSIVNPSDLDHRRSSEVCGQCHSINLPPDLDGSRTWNEHGFPYTPGKELARTRHVVRYHDEHKPPTLQRLLRGNRLDPIDWWDQRFWSDGMVRVSGREYNGLIESPCFQRGKMSCLSCHQLHADVGDAASRHAFADDQLAQKTAGNAACTQCHARFKERSVLEAHTHHRAASSGSRCYDCHMPHTTYGLLKAIRSHTIDSPSVQSTLATGRPNACNLCHLDRTLAWTAQHLHAWYSIAKPELNADQHRLAASLLWLLSGDAGQRALSAWHFGWRPAQETSGTDWMAPFLAPLLDDPYDAVRLIARRSLRSLPGLSGLTFDCFAEAGPRRKAATRLAMPWHAKRRGPRPSIPINPDGHVDASILRRLMRQRNRRKVRLAE